MISQNIKIQNKKGLHARATAKFVKLVENYQAEVTVTKGDMTVTGSSIMGLLMLGASLGSEVTITANGGDAEDVMAAAIALIERKFDEE